jgi:hypothetical protein
MSRDRVMGQETFEHFVWLLPGIARRYGFPPPDGAPKWSRDVCKTWVLDFFEKKGHEVAVKLFLSATDESSFTLLVRTSIANELKDQAKATEAGKMRSRMRTLLVKEPDFVDATALFAGDPAWTLVGFEDAIYTGDWEDLLRTPALKAIEPIEKLNEGGPTSRQNRERLVAAARIILQAAGGAMRDQVLGMALVTLFELDRPASFLVREDDVEADPGKPLEAPDLYVVATEAADEIIYQLSPDEGIALLVLDQPLAIAAAFLPHIPELPTFLSDLKIKLQGLIDRTDLPPGTVELVLDWCRKLPHP